MYSIKDTYDFSSSYMLITEHIDNTKTVFKDYLNDGYKLVNEKQQKIDKKFSVIQSKGDEEAQIFYQQDYEPERIKYYDLRNVFLYAGISFLYSQFEISFLNIAISTQKFYQSKVSIYQYNYKCKKLNKGIIKSKNYLIDNYKINIQDLEKDWGLIDNFRKLRNYYVHRNGALIKDPKLLEYIKSESTLSFENGSIEITKDYLIYISEILFKYLHSVMERLYERHKTLF